MIWIATAVGGVTAGFTITYVGFSLSLALLVLVSATIGVPALMLRKIRIPPKKLKLREVLAPIDPRGRTGLFWVASTSLMFASLTVYPLVTLLLPVYMSQQLSYDYVAIGFVFLLYNALSAIGTYFSLKRPLGIQRAVILSAISIVACSFIIFSNVTFLIAILALAIVRGYGIGFFEHTIIRVMNNPENVSVDIGLIHIPQRIAEFVSTLSAGFLVQSLGFGPVFLGIGICFVPYSLIALYVINRKR
jgi:MFS family permease